MAQLCPNLAHEHIAIDGKTLRGSHTADGALHLVSAWHCGKGVTPGQIRTQAKSNEISAIPEWRYYISSEVLDAQAFNAAIRAH